MIRKLLATTAIATLVASGAYAQTAPAPTTPMEQSAPQVIHADGHLASTIIGQTVYNSSAADAENIGKVNDLVISPMGDVEAIVVGVGGFLGIGQKNVALEYDLAEWSERDGNQWLVVNTTRDALEALDDFDTSAYRPMPADAQVGNTKPATAEQIGAAPATGTAPTDDSAAVAPTDDTATAPSDDTAAAPADQSNDMATNDGMAEDGTQTSTDKTHTAAIDRSTLTEMPVAGMSADDFIGTTVYGANDENVGSINDVILSTDDSTVDGVVIDVGGFLGIGSKPVAIGMDNLAFMTDADGKTYLYTQFTKEQLEAQPQYDKSTFAEHRTEQLLIAPAN